MVLSTVNQQSSSFDDKEDAGDNPLINQEELRTLKRSMPKGKLISKLHALSSENLRKPSPAQLLKRSNSSYEVHAAKARKDSVRDSLSKFLDLMSPTSSSQNKIRLLKRNKSMHKSKSNTTWGKLDTPEVSEELQLNGRIVENTPDTLSPEASVPAKHLSLMKRASNLRKSIGGSTASSDGQNALAINQKDKKTDKGVQPTPPEFASPSLSSVSNKKSLFERTASFRKSRPIPNWSNLDDIPQQRSDDFSLHSSSIVQDNQKPNTHKSDFCSDDFTMDSEPHKDGVSEEMKPGLQFAPSTVSAHLTERAGQIDESSLNQLRSSNIISEKPIHNDTSPLMAAVSASASDDDNKTIRRDKLPGGSAEKRENNSIEESNQNGKSVAMEYTNKKDKLIQSEGRPKRKIRKSNKGKKGKKAAVKKRQSGEKADNEESSGAKEPSAADKGNLERPEDQAASAETAKSEAITTQASESHESGEDLKSSSRDSSSDISVQSETAAYPARSQISSRSPRFRTKRLLNQPVSPPPAMPRARNNSPRRSVKKSRPLRKLATEEEYSTKIENSSSGDAIDSSQTTIRGGARRNRRKDLQHRVSMGNAPMATHDNGGISSRIARQKSAGSASLDTMRSPKGQRPPRKDKGYYIASFLGNSGTSFDRVPTEDSRA